MNHLQELHELLYGLYTLGRNIPQCLLYLTEIIQPNLMPDIRISILESMFLELKEYLNNLSEIQLQTLLISRNAIDDQTLRLFLDLREIALILKQISATQLLHISNHVIPPGPIGFQIDFISKIKGIFSEWTEITLCSHHNSLTQTNINQGRQQFLLLEPKLPIECLHLLIEVFKLPLGELLSFHKFITSLQTQQIEYLTKLLQLEPSIILAIKQCLFPNSNQQQPSPFFNNNINNTNNNNMNNHSHNNHQVYNNGVDIPAPLHLPSHPHTLTPEQSPQQHPTPSYHPNYTTGHVVPNPTPSSHFSYSTPVPSPSPSPSVPSTPSTDFIPSPSVQIKSQPLPLRL
eukprot:TRINITY_DN3200_c0_g1_i2.p1 TRINITY_DN3200_c0_g1~~TRINITY_DN3200_c0_g1_i2.p1  ORF type:complete len:345 (+),score=74.13 TRINITY_DN3200_c0_g1_i2:142-1176(+)